MIPKRFERLTHALEGRCSIQLSYGTILICAAKLGFFVDICKKKQKFLAEIMLFLDFLFVHLGSADDIIYKIIGFTTSKITIFTDWIVEVFFVTLQ